MERVWYWGELIQLIVFSYVSVPRDWCFGFFTSEFEASSKGKEGKRVQGMGCLFFPRFFFSSLDEHWIDTMKIYGAALMDKAVGNEIIWVESILVVVVMCSFDYLGWERGREER